VLGDHPNESDGSGAAGVREHALSLALDVASGIENDWGRLQAIQALAPRLQDGEVTRLLDLARSLNDARHRAAALVAVAPRLDASGAERAGAAARGIIDARSRLAVLLALATRPDPSLRERALYAALALGNTPGLLEADARAEALASLAPLLDAAQLDRALSAALATALKRGSVREIAALARHLDAGARATALAVALDAVEALKSPGAAADALTTLAPHLDKVTEQRAFNVAMALDSVEHRVSALVALAPRADDDSLARMLDFACTVGDAGAREKLLRTVVPCLRGAHRHACWNLCWHCPTGANARCCSTCSCRASIRRCSSARLTPRSSFLPATLRTRTFGRGLSTRWRLASTARCLTERSLGSARSLTSVTSGERLPCSHRACRTRSMCCR
jgi:hypothetical protein